MNFDQCPSFLDVDVSSFALASDEAVGSFKVSAESVVGVNDCETAGIPTDFAVLSVPVPKRLCHEEVVVLELTSEW